MLIRLLQQFQKIKKIFSLSWKAFRRYRYHLILLAALGFVGGLLEGIGITALIPLFSLLIDGGGTSDNIITTTLENLFSFAHVDFTFRYILLLIILLFILKAVLLFIFSYIKIGIVAGYEATVRSQLFKETLQSNWPALLKQKLGHLETILMINVGLSAKMLDHISQSIITTATLIVFAGIAFTISPNITIITLVLGTIVFLGFKPIISMSRRAHTQLVVVNRNMAHYVNENILGMKTVKSLAVEHKVTQSGDRLIDRLKALRIRTFLLRTINNIATQPVGVIFVSIIFAYSYTSGEFRLASFIAIVYLIQRIFIHIESLISLAQRLGESVPYLENVLKYQQKTTDHYEIKGGDKPFMFQEALFFNSVKFSYGNDKKVLSDITFTLAKGEFVGLVGSSGSGKTTIVDLLLRLFIPIKGEILLDGHGIQDINLSEWRKHIGYISQDIFLMNDTVENNIRFYDDTLSFEEIEIAAKKAHIYDDIMSRPKGFQVNVGERGTLFSAGQRQRLVIARILARKPDILILDEATSALDNESEVQIQKVIKKLKGEVTVLAITHRLSTIMSVDNLLVLDRGHIIEEGKPHELLKNKESYFFRVHSVRE